MALHKGDRVTHYLRPDRVFEIVEMGGRMARLYPIVENDVGDMPTFWAAQSVLHRIEGDQI